MAKAVMQRREGSMQPVEHTFEGIPDQEPLHVSYTLPKGHQGNFIILDVQRDTTERVVDKLIQCMSMGDDSETRSLNFPQFERTRLFHAWELFLLYKKNSDWWKLVADIFEYSI